MCGVDNKKIMNNMCLMLLTGRATVVADTDSVVLLVVVTVDLLLPMKSKKYKKKI